MTGANQFWPRPLDLSCGPSAHNGDSGSSLVRGLEQSPNRRTVVPDHLFAEQEAVKKHQRFQ